MFSLSFTVSYHHSKVVFLLQHTHVFFLPCRGGLRRARREERGKGEKGEE